MLIAGMVNKDERKLGRRERGLIKDETEGANEGASSERHVLKERFAGFG
jgi:hypothetical protein